jgi:CheY-like chemotaxis protein
MTGDNMNPKPVRNECARAKTQPVWMVVDDNIDILNVTRVMLTRITDALVECFQSPTDALAAFQAAPRKYALVITDFEMPEMNGAELCHRLQKILPVLNVLLVTGSGIASRTAVSELGFCGRLQKPFVVAELKRALMDAGVFEKQAADDFTKESSSLMMA